MICGKRIFESQEKANELLGRKRFTLTKSYFCPDCNGWHVTSEIGKPREKTPRIRELNTKEESRSRKNQVLKIHVRNFKVK